MMITYAEAMEAVQGVVCPNCLHAELSADLHMAGRRECICTARCEHCGAEFEIEYTRFERLDDIQRRLEASLQTIPCFVCAQRDYALSLKCVYPSQNCYFQARCRNCGAVYHADELHGQVNLAPPSE